MEKQHNRELMADSETGISDVDIPVHISRVENVTAQCSAIFPKTGGE